VTAVGNSLFSQSWYRVADMKPRLRTHAQIHRHTYRGKDWYVLQDHSSGRFHRFSPEAYLIIGFMDGRHTLGEIWEMACARLGDDMPTQDEVITLLSQLHRADVLQSDIPPDVADLYERHVRGRRNRRLGNLRSPMAMRFRLLDPDRFLERTQFIVRPLLGWAGVVLWNAVVLSALFLVGIHWNELTSNLADRVLALENLLLLWVTYPIVKTLHEFGHAYAVKRWGGEVHEMGIMLLVLMPVPYVDASSSSAFPDKRKRMLVGAAGILVEAFLAALAMFVWVNVEPGAVRAVAFNVMLVAGVSTLLFNGNPLLRFDAYYILADYLEIPNLASRGNQYLGYLLQRYVLGIRDAHSPTSASGEASWLSVYALASFIYRIFISVKIVLFVAGKFFGVGVVLTVWAAFSMLILPFIRVSRYLFADAGMKSKRGRIILTGALAAGLFAVLVLVVPIPSFTVAEGVLWTPEECQVYAGADSFIVKVLAVPGQVVHRGNPLVLCEDPELAARVEVLKAQLREFESRHRASMVTDLTEANILKDKIDSIRSELVRAQERQEELLIRSSTDGTFLMPQAEDLPGRFVRRGTPLGYVVDFSQVIVRVVVSQSDVDRVRKNTRKVEARLSEAVDRTIPSLLVREVPAASKELPSLALSLEGGGDIALDPREAGEPQSFEKMFQFDIALSGVEVRRFGERVFIRFEHDPEPLASRWRWSIRRMLLRRFDI
jgi:putative peptide zinc metalloprotease protein